MNTLFDSALSAAITVLLQSTVILGAALVVARCLRRNSSLRYPVLLSALVITFLSAGWAVWNPGRTQGILIQATASDPGPAVAPPAEETGTAHNSITPQIVSVDQPAVAEEARLFSPDRERSTTPLIVAPASSETTWVFSWRWTGGTLLVLWLSGSILLLVRLLAGLRSVRRLVRNAIPLPVHEARRVWGSVAGEFGADDKVPPPILLSPDIATPVVVGAVRSRLLLPESMLTDLDGSRLRAVLAHEIAHILRRDTLVGLVERWAQILLWPQPLLGIFLRTLDRSREEICDNYALTVSDRHSYGSLLLTLSDAEAPRATPPPRLVAMGLLTGRWSLEQRISDLLNPNRNTMTKATLHHWIAPTTVIATIALILGSTRITFAAPEDEREEKSERRERDEPEKVDRERDEREGEERREGNNFEAQVRELKAAMHEATERGQKDRAQQLENKLKELLAHREGKGRERDEREGEERREGNNFEAQVRELKAAMHEATERGQKDRAQQLENKLKELLAHREGKGRERDEREGEERREGNNFEAQVRELKAAMHEAAERGQEDRAQQLENKLKELLAHREGKGRERDEREGEERREGNNFEAQVRELKAAMHEAAERGQEDRAHQIELKLKNLLAHREGADSKPDGDERAVHLERRLHEMAKHVEEIQRAMQEMRHELERMRKDR